LRLGIPIASQGLVLVDGGLWPDVAPEHADRFMHAALSMYLERIERSWQSFDEYLAYFGATPVYASGVDDYAVTHFHHDLDEAGSVYRSRVDMDAVSADFADLMNAAVVLERLGALECPVMLPWPPGGLTGTGDEVLPDVMADAMRHAVPQLEVVDILGANHHTILLSIAGARAAAAIASFVRRTDA
jgi:hypothetical protein